MAFVSNSPNTKPEKRTGFTFRGNEIVLSKTHGRPFNGIRKKEGWYPDAKRIEVVTLYACLGNPDTISELANVPAWTIRNWVKTPWFKELLEEIRTENNEKMDAKFAQIVEKAQDCILDRLENGDHLILRDESTIRKPINAKDLAAISSLTVDKRQIIRNKPTSISQSVNSGEVNEDKLKLLAKTFIELVNKKEIKEVTVEGSYTEVKNEEEPIDANSIRTGTSDRGPQEGT